MRLWTRWCRCFGDCLRKRRFADVRRGRRATRDAGSAVLIVARCGLGLIDIGRVQWASVSRRLPTTVHGLAEQLPFELDVERGGEDVSGQQRRNGVADLL